MLLNHGDFSNVRRYFKGNTTESEEPVDRNISCSDDTHFKKRKISHENHDSELDDPFSKSEEIASQLYFRPPHLIDKWLEPETTTKMLSGAIILPSGVGKNDFTVRIIEDGTYLELSMLWPKPLQEPKRLLRNWLRVDPAEDRIQPYHPEGIDFESALKDLRENVLYTIRAACRLILLFPVQYQYAHQSQFRFSDVGIQHIYILFLRMKAFSDEYDLKKDLEFEKV